ncbi:GDP-mannose mannosyl hydrolase [Psychrobacter sp. CAL346-MNA-CIBAN-0220]|uniref:GDP-mannose mannosyl hydrolase n=1 Tax=Psychrobacter sp. CAL346-MNA-CIBAN-0220 TaxID=3140457 RepID=UPI0033298E31
MYLNDVDFQTVIQDTPLVSIDLIIKNTQGHILLGKRNNRPAQGYWFVPGGRIRKNESLAMAFKRLTLAELDQAFSIEDTSFLGVFEHFYGDSVFGNQPSTHYVAMAYEFSIDHTLETLPLDQHHKYQWFTIKDLLQDADVHENTKAYF